MTIREKCDYVKDSVEGYEGHCFSMECPLSDYPDQCGWACNDGMPGDDEIENAYFWLVRGESKPIEEKVGITKEEKLAYCRERLKGIEGRCYTKNCPLSDLCNQFSHPELCKAYYDRDVESEILDKAYAILTATDEAVNPASDPVNTPAHYTDRPDIFRDITNQMAQVYEEKNHDYGNSFVNLRHK